MKKNLISILLASFLVTLSTHAQKPSAMVFPSDQYMETKGYGKYIETENTISGKKWVSDYNQFFLEDFEGKTIVQAIERAFLELDYPLKNLENELRILERRSADRSYSSLQTEMSMRDILLNTAKPDIRIEVGLKAENVMGQLSVDFQLAAYDAYNGTNVANSPNMSTGRGGSANLNALVSNAVIKNMPEFEQGFINHFNNIVENGRNSVLEITISEDCGCYFYDYFGTGDNEEELSFIFREYVKNGTVNRSPRVATNTETYMKFEDVMVPLYDDNGDQQDAAYWAQNNIVRKLRTDFGLVIRREEVGLGELRLVVMGGR